jgi:hypothetical protein
LVSSEADRTTSFLSLLFLLSNFCHLGPLLSHHLFPFIRANFASISNTQVAVLFT